MGASLARSRREQVAHPTRRSMFLSGFESLETLRPAMGMCRHKGGNLSFVFAMRSSPCAYTKDVWMLLLLLPESAPIFFFSLSLHFDRNRLLFHLNPRHSGLRSIYRISSRSSLLRFGLSFPLVESWIFSFADIRSEASQGC